MRLDIKHHGRGVFKVSGIRGIIRGQCRIANLDIRIADPSPQPGSYPDEILNTVLMSQIAVALEKMDYKPGPAECVDCADCQEQCQHKGMEG